MPSFYDIFYDPLSPINIPKPFPISLPAAMCIQRYQINEMPTMSYDSSSDALIRDILPFAGNIYRPFRMMFASKIIILSREKSLVTPGKSRLDDLI